MTTSLAELRRQALAQNIQIRRVPAGFVAKGAGTGSRDIIARTPAELRVALVALLGRAPA